MRFTHLRAVVLDWAGTTVDFGSRAPIAALQRTFQDAGIEVTEEEARRDMGVLKKDHIRAILGQPRVRAAWAAAHGAEPDESDTERLFGRFLPVEAEVLATCSNVIPGVAAAVDRWRAAGLRIGSTTGYTRELLDPVRERAAAQGYAPDASVTPDIVGAGRPLPFMMYRNALDLGFWPLWACVKIGDTPVDVQEGLNAGTWTIGITETGNEVGLSEDELSELSGVERRERVRAAEENLRRACAHFTAAEVAECDRVLEEIDHRLASGRGPWES